VAIVSELSKDLKGYMDGEYLNRMLEGLRKFMIDEY